MPSIPNGGLLDDENDLMQLDDALNFEVDEALLGGFVPPLDGEIADITAIGAARHAASRGPSSSDIGTGFTMGSTGTGSDTNGGNSSDDPVDGEPLDPSNPKHKRRIQNRLASARFRAKAKERQNELDKLKSQVALLRREKKDLEDMCVKIKEQSRAEADAQRASTMAWIVDHFWLRRKVHFKTLANSVRWMVSGKYKPGMSEAVAELMAAQTAERSADGDANGVEIEELNQDQDLSGFGDDDAPAGSADPSAAIAAGSPSRIMSQAMDEDGSEASTPTFGQRLKQFLTDSFKKRMERLGKRLSEADEAELQRPHTR